MRNGKADQIRDIFIYLTGAVCIIFADRRLFHQSHGNGSGLTAPKGIKGIAETREVITGDHFGLIIVTETQSGRVF